MECLLKTLANFSWPEQVGLIKYLEGIKLVLTLARRIAFSAGRVLQQVSKNLYHI